MLFQYIFLNTNFISHRSFVNISDLRKGIISHNADKPKKSITLWQAKMIRMVIALSAGLGIIMIVMFFMNDILLPNSLRATGYEKTEGAYVDNSCGNGILPENISCANSGIGSEGDENIVRLEGIVFP